MASISNTFKKSSSTNNADPSSSNPLDRTGDLENRPVTSNEVDSTASKISKYVSFNNDDSSDVFSQALNLNIPPVAKRSPFTPIYIGRGPGLKSDKTDANTAEFPDNNENDYSSSISSLANRRGKGLGTLRINSSSSSLSAKSQGLDWQNFSGDFSQVPVLRSTLHGVRVDQATTDQASFSLIPKSDREEKCLVSIKQGKMIVNGSELNTDHNEMIFVFLRNGKMYVAQAVPEKVFHSSLVHPDDPDVIAAGTINVVNGIPFVMDEKSGHFKPYNRVGYAAAALRHMGCNVSQLEVHISPYAPIDDTERSPTTPQEKLARLQEILNAKKTLSSPSQSPLTSSPQGGLQRTLSGHFNPSSRRSVSAILRQPPPESKENG